LNHDRRAVSWTAAPGLRCIWEPAGGVAMPAITTTHWQGLDGNGRDAADVAITWLPGTTAGPPGRTQPRRFRRRAARGAGGGPATAGRERPFARRAARGAGFADRCPAPLPAASPNQSPFPPGAFACCPVGRGPATAGRERASARQQAGGRLLDLLRLLAGRSRRAPGGAHHDAGAGLSDRCLARLPAPRPNQPCRFRPLRGGRRACDRGPRASGRAAVRHRCLCRDAGRQTGGVPK
jgi:hypothetical protein